MERRNLFTYAGACLAGLFAWAMPKSQDRAVVVASEPMELKAYERPKLQMRFVHDRNPDPYSIGMSVLEYKFEDEDTWQSVPFI